ncbi:HAMP domain-containing protein [bacterium]|nr:HAMP domain-containing protein [bacterium]
MTESTPQTTDPRTRISIRWKVLFGFTVIFLFFYIVALNVFTNLAITAADQQIQNDLTQTLIGTAEGINVQELLDLAATGEPNEAGFSDDARFEDLIAFLDSVHQIEPDAWPYLYIASENPNEIYFVVDLWARYDAASAGGFMEAYTSNSGFIVAGLSERVYRAVDHRIVQDIKNYASSIEDNRPKLASWLEGFGNWLTDSGIFPQKEFGTYGDRYGRWASGYQPLYDAAGEPVAAIGVDFQADYINEVRTTVSAQVRSMFLYAFPVLILVVVLATTFFTRPILKLSEGAEKIAEGDYEVDFSDLTQGRFTDEIHTLANAFSIMVSKVREREMTLRRQVARLRIEIDETKKKTEVSQIVDSDFFRDLQSRATNLRSRRTDNKDE